MLHCCQFDADDIYYLEDTDLCSNRTLAIGFCPVCQKPIAELKEYGFAGGLNKVSAAGMNAHNLMLSLKDDIVYSVRELNYKKFKSKPYGWKYGINKSGKNGKVRQYACDFYGNKELVKKIM